jgi:hypothetical protein
MWGLVQCSTVLGVLDRGLRPTFEQLVAQLDGMIKRMAKESDPLLAQTVTLSGA